MKWVKASNGVVPTNSQIGGEEKNHEHIYLARAMHNGALIPGKFIESERGTYVAWGGKEYKKFDYEVLTNGPSTWIKTSGSKIPLQAFPGGNTETHEVLFIGRAPHDGFMTPGKVQASRGCLIITFGGLEVEYKDYEILCH